MSYELDSHDVQSCPCGNGTVVKDSYSNDWNQVRIQITLCCDECSAKYHIEKQSYHRHGMVSTREVLVPNTMTLSSLLPRNRYSTPIADQFCYSYSFEELKSVAKELSAISACSKIKTEKSRKAVRMCRETCQCGRIAFVREKIQEALDLYPSLEHTHDSEKERLDEVLKHLILL